MFRVVGRPFIVLALCLAIGGHLLGLQSIAWAKMIVNYSQRCSIKEAIVQTFDGHHPCDLCKQIGKARDAENKQERRIVSIKTDLICTVRQVAFLPRVVPLEYLELTNQSVWESQEPPSPPPRAQLA
jgi:hypothetical protein